MGASAFHCSIQRIQTGAELAGHHGSGAPDADSVLSRGICDRRDYICGDSELAQRPVRLLGQRDNGRHCRRPIHSLCIGPRLFALVAGPPRASLVDRGVLVHGTCPHRLSATGGFRPLAAAPASDCRGRFRGYSRHGPSVAHGPQFVSTRSRSPRRVREGLVTLQRQLLGVISKAGQDAPAAQWHVAA